MFEASETHRLHPAWRVVLPIAAAGAVVAIAAPTLGARDLWLDEGFTIAGSRQLPEGIWWRSCAMATYYLFMAGWSKLSLDPTLLRLPSVLFAAMAVGLTVRLAMRMFSAQVAAVTAIVLAPMWGVIRYAQEARSYTLVMLLTVLGWTLVVELRDADRQATWVGWGLVTGLLVYSHPFGAFTVPAQAVALLLGGVTPLELYRRSRGGLLVLALALAPMGISLLQGYERVPEWIPPLGRDSLSSLTTMIGGPVGWAQVVVALSLLLATLVALWLRPCEWGVGAVMAWAWVPGLLIALVSLVTPSLLGRYLIGSLPAVALLLALAVTALPHVAMRAIATVGVVVALLPGLVDMHSETGPPWSEAIDVVVAGADVRLRHGMLFPDAYNRPALQANAAGTGLFERTDPVFPDHPWDESRRYHEDRTASELAPVVAGYDVVWAVWQDNLAWAGVPSWEPATRALFDAWGYCPTEEHRFEQAINVIRFERCGA